MLHYYIICLETKCNIKTEKYDEFIIKSKNISFLDDIFLNLELMINNTSVQYFWRFLICKMIFSTLIKYICYYNLYNALLKYSILHDFAWYLTSWWNSGFLNDFVLQHFLENSFILCLYVHRRIKEHIFTNMFFIRKKCSHCNCV
jgi:hypothetical protein